MFNFGRAKLYAKGAASDEWVPIGESDAMIIEMGNGRKIRAGDPAALFDLEQTDEDRELLAGMKVSTK